MKLIFCPKCQDVRKLHRALAKDPIRCLCGKSWGRYLDDEVMAEVGGKAVVLGIDNRDFERVYRTWQRTGGSYEFQAFTIDERRSDCHVVREPAPEFRPRDK